MYYYSIVVYRRQGDKATPVRLSYSSAYGYTGERILSWEELYGNHTSWVAEDIKQRQKRHAQYI
jgi:hypothetical protein